MKSRVLVVLICVMGVIIFVSPSKCLGQLLTNGDFENPSLPVGTHEDFLSGSLRLHGWIVGGPSEAQVALCNGPDGVNRPTAPSGNQLAFNGGDSIVGAFIEQIFQAMPGHTYELSYHVGRGGLYPGIMALQVELFDSSNVLLAKVVSVAPDIANSYGTLQVIDFKAVTQSTMLRITDVSSTTESVDVYLDQVAINLIPEPCSLVLLSLGGLMLRRKK